MALLDITIKSHKENFTGDVPDSNVGNIVIKVCKKQINSALGLHIAIFLCMIIKKGGGLLYG